MNKHETSIRVFDETKKRLSKHKIHPNQSFDEVLNTIMDIVEQGAKSSS